MVTLEDFGSFYIGGNTATVSGQPMQKVARNDQVIMELDPNGDYSSGAMYIQYYKPTKSTGTYLLIHGGGLSGAIWENTQFTQQSWVKELLALNKTVYIIDIVGIGRSGHFPFDAKLSLQDAELRSKEQTWKYFRFGKEEDYAAGKLYKNSKSSFDKFQLFVKQNVPRWNDYIELPLAAVKELLKIESNWHVIAHSQGADIALRLLGETQVNDLLLIESGAFPSLKDVNNIAGKTVGFLYGDYIDSEHSPFWVDFLARARQSMAELKDRGVMVKELHLPDINIHGNTHVLMCDSNASEVFSQAMTLMSGGAKL
jgi:pimeloyl-ACP methyl ester carboxylesterase